MFLIVSSFSPDEDNEDRKSALRSKVTKYITRAEELKTLVRDGRPRIASGDELIPSQQLSKFKGPGWGWGGPG